MCARACARGRARICVREIREPENRITLSLNYMGLVVLKRFSCGSRQNRQAVQPVKAAEMRGSRIFWWPDIGAVGLSWCRSGPPAVSRGGAAEELLAISPAARPGGRSTWSSRRASWASSSSSWARIRRGARMAEICGFRVGRSGVLEGRCWKGAAKGAEMRAFRASRTCLSGWRGSPRARPTRRAWAGHPGPRSRRAPPGAPIRGAAAP